MNHITHNQDNTLFIFLDESGNLDFSTKGTKHYVLAAVSATQPITSSSHIQGLKYNLLLNGIDIEHFHASEDLQAIRSQVFSLINKLSTIKVNYIYANKHYAHPKYHDSANFYALLGKTLLKYMFSNRSLAGYSKVVVVFDKALNNKEQSKFLKIVKPELKHIGIPYSIYFHRTLLDFNSQIADYAAWAKYVSLERGEDRPLESLDNIPSTDFNIFKNGKRTYY